MYTFPKGLYTDVRIEDLYSTKVIVRDGQLVQNKKRKNQGVMIRVFDGNRWYYSALTDINSIQSEIDKLSQIATPNTDIENNPVVKKFEVNKGEFLTYKDDPVENVTSKQKLDLINHYSEFYKNVPDLQTTNFIYVDSHIVKHIISSKGTDVKFDSQTSALAIRGVLSINGLQKDTSVDLSFCHFNDIYGHDDKVKTELAKDIEYAKDSINVEPGLYTCILSPQAAGVFAHESFGHKSEADFMVGDETMIKEWAIGSKVGAPILTITDSGLVEGSGFVPFDDEGCRAKTNYIIKDGILTGRLHSTFTAAALSEEVTGNARAMNFEYEPIVRMTTTLIGKGDLTKEQLFADVKNGIFIDTIKHGSGMSTFTIAPDRAYLIKDGKVTTPVKISVITGNVMETLNKIDGVSDKVECLSFTLGGCGKMEQFPLPVGFGGPFVRVNDISVN